MLHCITKRKTTINLKSVNNQKHQKIKLHRTPTTKELKKKSTRTTRPVRRQDRPADSEKPQPHLDTGDWAGCPAQQAVLGGAGVRGLRGGCGLWLGFLRYEKLPVS